MVIIIRNWVQQLRLLLQKDLGSARQKAPGHLLELWGPRGEGRAFLPQPWGICNRAGLSDPVFRGCYNVCAELSGWIRPSWGSRQGEMPAWVIPEVLGRLGWFFPAQHRDRACGVRQRSAVSPFGLPDTKVPPSTLAVYLISLGFRWLLVEWSVPNYIIGCIVS